MIAAGAAAALGTVVTGATVVVPRLKQVGISWTQLVILKVTNLVIYFI